MPVLPPAPLLVPELPMSALASRAEAGVAVAGRSGILFPPDSFMLPSKYSRQTADSNSGADRAKLVLSCRN
jgi:hypothetical protein